ncbi:MAG: hypothetical protein P5675_26335, partial [Limnospira sp. PMC 917.15]|nr:hypothetical protein [Limnospira sp. PMC 917.15]
MRNFDVTLQEMAEEDEEVKREFQEKFSNINEFIRDMKLGLETVQNINTSMRNASRSDLEKVSSDLREICEEACLILGAKLKMHRIEKEFPEEFPFVKCHRSQIGQVFMNFLSN